MDEFNSQILNASIELIKLGYLPSNEKTASPKAVILTFKELKNLLLNEEVDIVGNN